ncbi:MAG: MFS transporter [Chloroflexi bacterium]|nr:MFS transporter [Chloroflexota bacterium]
MGSVPYLGAPTVYLILRAGFSLCFSTVGTVNQIYQAETAQLNPLQLSLVGTVMAAAVLLGEAPTGVAADTFGRRRSVIIGHALVGVGFLIEGLFPFFAPILAAQAVVGIGWTFISGAREAWIADEVGEARAGSLFLRGAQAAQLGTLAGILVSVALGGIRLNLPIVLGGGLMLAFAALLPLIMTEHGFTPAPRGERSPWRALGQTLGDGLALARSRPVVLTIFAIAAVSPLGMQAFDRLWTPHMLDDVRFPDVGGLQPVAWFGVLRMGALLLSIAGTEVVRRRLDTTRAAGVVRALFAGNLLIAVGVIVFGLASDFAVALAAFWVISALRRTCEPLWQTWVNLHLDTNVRATVFSLISQTEAIGEIVSGPAFGALALAASLPVALTTAGVAYLSVLPLFALALRQGRKAAVGEEPL